MRLSFTLSTSRVEMQDSVLEVEKQQFPFALWRLTIEFEIVASKQQLYYLDP